jgi:hypothetical protein
VSSVGQLRIDVHCSGWKSRVAKEEREMSIRQRVGSLLRRYGVDLRVSGRRFPDSIRGKILLRCSRTNRVARTNGTRYTISWVSRLSRGFVWAIVSIGVLTSVAAEDQPKTIVEVGCPTDLLGPSFPLSEFNESHSGISLSRTAPRDPSYLPDVISRLVGLGGHGEYLQQLADKGLIKPLDSFLEEIGISPADFLPNTIEAVSYKKRIWAIPHQVTTFVLAYNKALFKNLSIKPSFGSWEELLETALKISNSQIDGRPVIGFLQPGYPLVFCEYMANAAGSQLFCLEDPSMLKSDELFKAFSLMRKYQANGAIRSVNDAMFVVQTMSSEYTAGIGLNNFFTVESSEFYGVLDWPARLLRDDTPKEGWSVRANLECFAIKTNTPAKEAAAFEFLKWLMSKETQLRTVELSDMTVPFNERLVRINVHVPLIKTVIESPEFQRIVSQHPDYAVLLRICKAAHFPRRPGKLEAEAYRLAEKTIEVDAPSLGLRNALAKAYEAVVELTEKSTVRSTEFDEY